MGIVALLSALLDMERHLKPLRWAGAGFIAAISYSLYLSHKLVIHADDVLLPESLKGSWGMVAIYYVSSIAVAAGLYFAVERPFMLLRNVVLKRMKKPLQRSEAALKS